jgi:uncharacterized damage-inducible protein DinB
MDGVDPLLGPILFSFQQAREDLELHTNGLTVDQLWATPYGFGSVGFHIRHIGGSVERLMTYVQGGQLSEVQLAALKAEMDPGASLAQLLADLDRDLRRAEELVRLIDPSTVRDVREVGRKRLPTTVIGLLTHIAEHTQRHVGQAISAAKLARVV